MSTVCFFFSSRRRHTRLQGDWSSDVCSSDLSLDQFKPHSWSALNIWPGFNKFSNWKGEQNFTSVRSFEKWWNEQYIQPKRSEERRVGKECREERGREHEREKGQGEDIAEREM